MNPLWLTEDEAGKRHNGLKGRRVQSSVAVPIRTPNTLINTTSARITADGSTDATNETTTSGEDVRIRPPMVSLKPMKRPATSSSTFVGKKLNFAEKKNVPHDALNPRVSSPTRNYRASKRFTADFKVVDILDEGETKAGCGEKVRDTN